MWSVIGLDGQEYGPVDEVTLRQWVGQGRVTPDTQVLGTDRVPVRAASLPWLFPPVGAAPMAGYPRDGGYGSARAPKSKIAAILLAVFLGAFGIHRFYLGHTSTGIAMLILGVLGICTFGISTTVTSVWGIVDAILIATGSLGDRDGAPVV